MSWYLLLMVLFCHQYCGASNCKEYCYSCINTQDECITSGGVVVKDNCSCCDAYCQYISGSGEKCSPADTYSEIRYKCAWGLECTASQNDTYTCKMSNMAQQQVKKL